MRRKTTIWGSLAAIRGRGSDWGLGDLDCATPAENGEQGQHRFWGFQGYRIWTSTCSFLLGVRHSSQSHYSTDSWPVNSELGVGWPPTLWGALFAHAPDLARSRGQDLYGYAYTLRARCWLLRWGHIKHSVQPVKDHLVLPRQVVKLAVVARPVLCQREDVDGFVR